MSPPRPHPNMMGKSYVPAPAPPPPPPPSLDVGLSGGGDYYISGAGCVDIPYSGGASGGDGGPYSFSIGFADVSGTSVTFTVTACVSNGGVSSGSVNLNATDSHGVHGNSGPVFWQLHSNPV